MTDNRYLKIDKTKDRTLADQIRKCIRKDKFIKLRALTASIHPDSVLNRKGQNGCHLSCKYGHPDCLNVFLSQGANKRFRDEKGNIPLHFAVKFCMNHPHPAVVRELITNPFLSNLELLQVANYKGTTPKLLLDALNRRMTQDVSDSDSSQDETENTKCLLFH